MFMDYANMRCLSYFFCILLFGKEPPTIDFGKFLSNKVQVVDGKTYLWNSSVISPRNLFVFDDHLK